MRPRDRGHSRMDTTMVIPFPHARQSASPGPAYRSTGHSVARAALSPNGLADGQGCGGELVRAAAAAIMIRAQASASEAA
jgi:hypothetical protein